MSWLEKVHSIIIETTDFSDEFGVLSRYDYAILLVDHEGGESSIPTTYSNIEKVKERAREIKKQAKKELGRKIPITYRTINCNPDESELKNKAYANKMKDKVRANLIKIEKRKRDAMSCNASPGGNYDHSQR
jgi:hypothetical protein